MFQNLCHTECTLNRKHILNIFKAHTDQISMLLIRRIIQRKIEFLIFLLLTYYNLKRMKKVFWIRYTSVFVFLRIVFRYVSINSGTEKTFFNIYKKWFSEVLSRIHHNSTINSVTYFCKTMEKLSISMFLFNVLLNVLFTHTNITLMFYLQFSKNKYQKDERGFVNNSAVF